MNKTLLNKFWGTGEFVRFLMTGVMNAVFGYSLFSLLIYLGLHYSLAALIATICGVIFNFNTTGTIVFRNRDNSVFLKFISVYIVLYFLNIACLKLFSDAAFSMYSAGAMLIVPMGLLSFILNKKWVFGVIK